MPDAARTLGAELNVRPIMVTAAVALAAVSDLPSYFSRNGITASAVLTASIAALGIVTLPAVFNGSSRGDLRPYLPFALFTIWSTVVGVASGLDAAALQTLSVFWMFLAVSLNAARFITEETADLYRWRLALAAFCTCILYGISVVVSGLGARSILGPRSFALEALVFLALLLPYRGSSRRIVRWLPLLLTLLALASLSRTATVIAILLYVAHLSFGADGFRWRRAVPLAAISLAGLVWAIGNVPVLTARFTGGDQGFRASGVTISLQGRGDIWGVVLSNYGDSPLIGHGAGSVRALISSRISGQTEPHNDFLRVLYDSGWIGMLLFIWACVALLAATAIRAHRAEDFLAARPHVAAFAALIAITVAFLTDNALIYSFIMAPLAVVVGISLSGGSAVGRRESSVDDRGAAV